jgi:hypothetical protein
MKIDGNTARAVIFQSGMQRIVGTWYREGDLRPWELRFCTLESHRKDAMGERSWIEVRELRSDARQDDTLTWLWYVCLNLAEKCMKEHQ